VSLSSTLNDGWLGESTGEMSAERFAENRRFPSGGAFSGENVIPAMLETIWFGNWISCSTESHNYCHKPAPPENRRLQSLANLGPKVSSQLEYVEVLSVEQAPDSSPGSEELQRPHHHYL